MSYQDLQAAQLRGVIATRKAREAQPHGQWPCSTCNVSARWYRVEAPWWTMDLHAVDAHAVRIHLRQMGLEYGDVIVTQLDGSE